MENKAISYFWSRDFVIPPLLNWDFGLEAILVFWHYMPLYPNRNVGKDSEEVF